MVTITPADRSNSPPIINMPTPTATIPIVDDWYNTVKNDSGDRNAGATIKKKIEDHDRRDSSADLRTGQQPVRQAELHPIRRLRRRTGRRRFQVSDS